MASRTKWIVCALTCLVAFLTTATFAQAQVTQFADNGCESPQPYAGAITTPVFTADPGSVITFAGWFEVESVSSTIDAISVEYSTTPADPASWTSLGDLRDQSATPSSSGPTVPYSNNGTGFAPSFQSYSFDLGTALGSAQSVAVRINFDTQDALYQGYRGVGIDNFNVSLASPAVSADFENGAPAGWTFDSPGGPGGPFWQVLQNPQNVSVKSPEINPQLVQFPDAGAPLPAPAGGSRNAWFGNVDSGTFCGPDFANRFSQQPTVDTFITGGPSDGTIDKNATFSFAGFGAASFQCQLDGGAFASCASPQSYSGLSNGTHTFAVRGIDGSGIPDPTPAAQTWTIREATLADLPNPQYGVSVNADQVKGTVRVGIPTRAASAGGSAHASQKGVTFVPLSEARQIPVGSFVDTRKGTVRLQSAANPTGKRQTGTFLQGLFQVKQSKKRSARGLTDLILKGSSFRRCGSGKGASAALSRATIRRLRASARGRYRTSGRNSSATVRGTAWDVTDRCDGTLTKVRRGRVVVRDFRRKKNITLTSGKSYLARAPG
jgi:hypothetical protein